MSKARGDDAVHVSLCLIAACCERSRCGPVIAGLSHLMVQSQSGPHVHACALQSKVFKQMDCTVYSH